MARNFSSPLLQRPGTVDPQERRRRPLNPLEDYPYEPEMPEVPMPQMGALPVPDITPGMAAPRLAPVNPTGWDTPPRDLSQFRAWYSGQPVEGAPAAPEWGRDTQTYSRLNPVEPKTTPERTIVPPRAPKMPTAGQTLGGGQPQVMQRPRGPVRPNAPMPSFNAPMGQQAMEQMQAREQRFFTPQQGPTMAAGMQQVTGAGMRPTPSPMPVQGPAVQPLANQARRQFLGRAAENLDVIRPASATPAQGLIDTATRRAQEAVMAGVAGPLAGTLVGKGGAANYRTLPQVGRDMGLELAAGGTLLAGMGFDLADLTTRSLGMMNPNFDPSSPGGFQALRSASESIDKVREEILAQRTPEYLQRKQEFDQKLEAAPQDVMSQIASYAAAVYDDPSMAEEAIISNLPQMLPSMAAGKIASIGKAAKAIKSARALSATSATGFLQTGVDAQKSSYDTLKQQYVSRGMNPKQADQLAFQNSLLSFFAGSGLGAVGGRTGLEQAAFGTGARGAMQRAGRVAAEFGTEALEEATPQAITNVQLGRPVTQGLGRTIAETAIATAPFAGMAALGRSDGGANKVPDALESEATPGPTGTTTRIPRSEQQQRYENWVAAGGTPAPFASQVGLRRPRQLPGRGALPGIPEGQRALPPIPTQPEPPSARVEAPFQPSPPTAPTGIRPQAPTEARPVTSVPPDVSFRPLETVGAPGARPVGLYERPMLQTVLQGQGAGIGAEIEDKLPALADEYQAKVEAARAKGRKYTKAEPGPEDVKGRYGMAASRMHRTGDAILEKFMGPFGIEARGQRRSIYPEVLSNITAEMQEIVPGVTESEVESAAKAGTKAAGRMREGVYDIWEQWHERFGKEKGLSEQDTLAMKNLVAGRKGLFFRPDVQAALGLTPGDPTANKQVHDVIREDMAKLMGMPPEVQGKPLKGVSLSLIPPQVWHNWMSLRGLDNEAEFPGFKQEMEDILRNQGRISDSVVRGESAPTPPAPTKPKAPPSPVTPQAPPSPAAPVAPSGPSALLRRYQGMTSVGMPRAPRTFVPGVPSRQQGPGFTRRSAGGITTGRPQGPRGIRGLLPDIDQETREEQEARAARERLKSRSPFARGRQAEQERIGQAIEGRRPPTPPEAVTPAPTPPTPPPAPTPAGEAVTPPSKPKAAPVKKEPTPKPAPLSKPTAARKINLEEISESAIVAFPDMMESEGGLLPLSRFTPDEQASLRKAGIVETATLSTGQTYEGVSAEYLWERRQELQRQRAAGRKAAPVKKEPTPKPAPKPAVPTGQPINEKTLTDRGWTKQKPDAYSGPNGEKLERDADRRGEPWVYTDRAGNTQGFPSAREAIKAIISEPEVAPAPPAPAKAKPAASKPAPTVPEKAQGDEGEISEADKNAQALAEARKLMRELAAELGVSSNLTLDELVRAAGKTLRKAEPAATKGVETAPAEVKEIFREIDAGKNKRTVRRRVQDDYKDGKKALFVADNIEQIIAEAEATGKVTKVCP